MRIFTFMRPLYRQIKCREKPASTPQVPCTISLSGVLSAERSFMITRG
ncbi:hypothetical protein D1AOALGA4SA_11537 [Olavius algarvensis Delta 1 endosymbiont]|nr:hypothetical protein D1AOALGA4SA_11537 [Olavius algarvensis Delta 1 endosymbiont]